MCGISGILGLHPSLQLDEQISEMNKLIEHRGPDGEGSYICQKENVALGHRRLAILDLSDAGKQPFISSCGRFVLVYNGEIYNFIELKEELIALNHSFSTTSDTEVLLASYKEWGSQCVTKFNGMWSFAIYDVFKKEVFCSRDRFGIKPFYYAITDEQILFGSEIKQVLPYLPNRTANVGILINYLIGGFENYSEETFFKGVRQLPPGHNMKLSTIDRSNRVYRFYDLEPASLNAEEEFDQIRHYEKLISDSIMLRLRSDVKVGSCLSGGLDSSTIAAIAASIRSPNSDKFMAIHAKSSESNTDESRFAKSVANAADIELFEIEPQLEDFTEALDEVIKCQEEPFGGPSIFMQFFVMRKAKELGCTVLLDGQGGDETLLGYERYYPTMLKSLPLREIPWGFKNVVGKSKLTPITLFLYVFYFMSSRIRRLVLLRKSNFINSKYRKYLDEKLIEDIARSYRNMNSLQKYEISSIQLPHLLRYEDKNSMWHSIEARLPFLDYRAVEAALAIELKSKFYNGWSKYVLRVIGSKYFPEEVAWRRSKLGFEAPDQYWLTSIEKEMKKTVCESVALKNLLSSKKLADLPLNKLWRLYNAAKWASIYSIEIE